MTFYLYINILYNHHPFVPPHVNFRDCSRGLGRKEKSLFSHNARNFENSAFILRPSDKIFLLHNKDILHKRYYDVYAVCPYLLHISEVQPESEVICMHGAPEGPRHQSADHGTPEAVYRQSPGCLAAKSDGQSHRARGTGNHE